MAANQNVLIVADTASGKLPAAVHELTTLASRLARQSGGRVCAVLLGDATEALTQELIARGVDRVFRTASAGIAEQVVEARLPHIVEASRQLQPRVVLLPHNVVGAELAPRLAIRLDGAVATGCVDVSVEGAEVHCTRPCYGGLAREVGVYAAATLVATVRAGLFEPAQPQSAHQGEVTDIALAAPIPVRTRVVERKLESAEGIRLEDARVIVAGGRGLEGPDGFRVLEQLAQELGGAVGASRVPCDLGWCPHSWQIGLTGKTVTPELYIAVGISGAGHHMAGCGNAKAIVAINTDPEAAILQDARFGVIGDYREVVPALAAEVRKLKQAS